MKTPIELTEYQFSGKNNPLYQISDHPVNKLVRVIEINRAEFMFDIDIISIKSTTHFIDPVLKIVVFSQPTMVEQKPWDIVKGDQTIEIDDDIQPVPNPDFNDELPVSPANYPYMLTDSYEQFKRLSIQLNKPLLDLFIDSNDQKALFD
ncbi:hypothetical protein CO230_08615 [Chryseobacterium sp. 6424]|uniref:hypothetical protein n=1 Tax=Chryseobacterium sp. 6424 TaxID=2039166 RepID=UPI000EFC07A0|nr:hypothetical protein [Chryseobacterium sp. 6424]AYO58176.1 hypothetical protein CO230_08615 [Chryseobacterium sp. 6424]